MCNIAYNVVSIYDPAPFTIQKNQKYLKNLHYF